MQRVWLHLRLLSVRHAATAAAAAAAATTAAAATATRGEHGLVRVKGEW